MFRLPLNLPWAPPEFSTTDPSGSSIFPLVVALAISGAMVAPVRAHAWVEEIRLLSTNGSFEGLPGYPRGNGSLSNLSLRVKNVSRLIVF